MNLFKSKKTRLKEQEVHKIGRALFSQIADARNSVQNKSLDEEDLLSRLNGMYTGGYFLSFVGNNLESICDSESERQKYANQIFNGIFPNNGIQFVQSKMEARDLGGNIAESSDDPDHRFNAKVACGEFDLGIQAGELEPVENPERLRDYLLTGKI